MAFYVLVLRTYSCKVNRKLNSSTAASWCCTSIGCVAAGAVVIDARRAAVVVQVTDVDDDDSNKDLKRDTSDEQRQHEVVEPVTLTSNVEKQL